MNKAAASEHWGNGLAARWKDVVSPHVWPVFRSQEEGRDLVASGWSAADLHVHTWCSYDVAPVAKNDPLSIYDRARRAGMRFITFTDHDTMDAYDRVGWTRDHVVPGVEIKIFDRSRVGHTVHVNVYGLDSPAFHELQALAAGGNIERFVEELRQRNLGYGYNHPFWSEPYEKLNVRQVFELMEIFPVLEYNMGRVLPLNMIAAASARSLGKGLVGTTDTHSGCVAEAFTLARGDTFADFWNEIVAGRALVVPQDLTIDRLAAEVLDRVECLLGRNNWEFAKPAFSLDTGIPLLDERLQPLLLDSSRQKSGLKRAFCWLVKALANSRFPHSLYIRSQNLMAEGILQYQSA